MTYLEYSATLIIVKCCTFMPTKKIRVGFIPRREVLDLIKKLSYENNLSNSKIINILVEEALHKRGMFDMRTGEISIDNNRKDYMNRSIIENANEKVKYDFNNYPLNNGYPIPGKGKTELLDKEIYDKFIMFLQFEENMKRLNL